MTMCAVSARSVTHGRGWESQLALEATGEARTRTREPDSEDWAKDHVL